jgi:hypothetical protein
VWPMGRRYGSLRLSLMIRRCCRRSWRHRMVAVGRVSADKEGLRNVGGESKPSDHQQRHVDLFCAPGVGRSDHYGTSLPRDGLVTFCNPLPNSKPQLRELLRARVTKRKLMVVAHPASIDTLSVTVARPCGRKVA